MFHRMVDGHAGPTKKKMFIKNRPKSRDLYILFLFYKHALLKNSIHFEFKIAMFLNNMKLIFSGRKTNGAVTNDSRKNRISPAKETISCIIPRLDRDQIYVIMHIFCLT